MQLRGDMQDKVAEISFNGFEPAHNSGTNFSILNIDLSPMKRIFQ